MSWDLYMKILEIIIVNLFFIEFIIFINHISFLKLKFILVLFDTKISFAHSDIQKLKLNL